MANGCDVMANQSEITSSASTFYKMVTSDFFLNGPKSETWKWQWAGHEFSSRNRRQTQRLPKPGGAMTCERWQAESGCGKSKIGSVALTRRGFCPAVDKNIVLRWSAIFPVFVFINILSTVSYILNVQIKIYQVICKQFSWIFVLRYYFQIDR